MNTTTITKWDQEALAELLEGIADFPDELVMKTAVFVIGNAHQRGLLKGGAPWDGMVSTMLDLIQEGRRTGTVETEVEAIRAMSGGATREPRTGKSFWVKRVNRVDWTKPLNGYALEGEFVNTAQRESDPDGTAYAVKLVGMDGEARFYLVVKCAGNSGVTIHVDGLEKTIERVHWAAMDSKKKSMHAGFNASGFLAAGKRLPDLPSDADGYVTHIAIAAKWGELAPLVGKPQMALFAGLKAFGF